MLNIDENLKQLYNQPNVYKNLRLYFPSLDLTIENDQIPSEKFELNESLFSDTDIRFGSCESAQVKITVADVVQDLKGLVFTITQVVDNEYELQLGTFMVESCKKQNNLRYKDIVAYDSMKKADIDVSDWYNNLTFPLTLSAFRTSLLAQFGVDEEVKTLPNDSMIVTKTINPSKLKGRDVLIACEEINGCFGHINRFGGFAHIVLEPSYGLYPSVTLLPADDLFPVSENDATYFEQSSAATQISTAMCKSVHFQEYTVKEIDKLQIRQEEGDIGAIVGTGTNAYVIEGNFLVYGKTADELNTIAVNAFGNMQKRPYRPYQSNNIGLPYIEVGDTIAFNLNDPVAGYVFKRILTGIQSLWDNFTAEGNEELEQNFGINKEIIQLQGRTAIIKKTVDEVSVNLSDLEDNTAAQLTIMHDNITAEVSRATTAEGELSGSVNVLAGQVILKVNSAGKIAVVGLTADPDTGTQLLIQADNIKLEGLVTANNNFKILLDGSIEAVNGKFSGTIEGADFIGGEINGSRFFSTSWDGNEYGVWEQEITIDSGSIKASRTRYNSGGYETIIDTTIDYNKVNTQHVNASIDITSDLGDFKQLLMGPVGNAQVIYDSSNYFRPQSNSSSRNYYIGNSTYPWTGIYVKNIYHTNSSGQIGFFGASGHTKTSVATMSTSGDLSTTISKLNSLITALQGYGLV